MKKCPQMSMRLLYILFILLILLLPVQSMADDLETVESNVCGMTLHTVQGFGTQVRKVQQSSDAARAGVRPGDLILAVNKVRIRFAYDVGEAITRSVKRKGAAILTVSRAGTSMVIVLTVE